MATKEISLQPWKPRGREKRKLTESLHRPDVDTDMDIPAEERRTLKIRMTANHLEMDLPLSTPIEQTSGRGNNHILAGDTTQEVRNTLSKLPSDGILEQSVSQMTTIFSNIVEHHGHANQHLASLEEDLAHAKLEEEKLKAMIQALEKEKKHHGHANQHLASLEEDLAHAKLEEEKLKAMIQALEKEKSEMNARVALMERKDLYDLLEAKMEGFQIANHPGTFGGFENPNLTITKKWVEIPTLNLEDFVRGHRTLQDEVDRTGIDVCYQSLLHALKATVGTLPNFLAVFEYMQNIFDSYVNPSNDPNVQPLVKGLDADDFSVDKFFGLQDPTSPDDV
ncbi:hypothetical protein R1flu_009347 [Riccia fluitans]|uniref:ATR-interacting protein n=1 Tax=Riccia fluitans TaxID=41844 RepID=A0ABD1Z1U3_9MARC